LTHHDGVRHILGVDLCIAELAVRRRDPADIEARAGRGQQLHEGALREAVLAREAGAGHEQHHAAS
jgi:hypothetical protein